MTIQKEDILQYMPLSKIDEAIDDDCDGLPDDVVWDSIVLASQRRIADIFGTEEIPPAYVNRCRTACVALVARALFGRRGFSGSENPANAEAVAELTKLESVAMNYATQVGSAITEKARLTGTNGLII